MTDTRPFTKDDRAEIARLWNQFAEHGGSKIRWSEEVQGWMTYEGDRFSPGTVEDAVHGLTMPEKETDK
jgi:hypothetical protein